MAESALDPTKVALEGSRITRLSYEVNREIEEKEDGKYNIEVKYSYKALRADASKSFLDLQMEIGNAGAPTYSVEIETRTVFTFPDGTSDEDKDNYLLGIGAMRACDLARAFIKGVTAHGAYGVMDVPGNTL